MKKQMFTLIQTCLLVLTLGFWQTSQAQTPFTITWTGLGGAGTTNATGVPTGITIVQQYNGVTANCVSSPSNGGTTYSAIIQAAAGYNVTITSIGGTGYGSNAGYKKFTFQLTNGAVYTQTNFSTVGSSSSCSGNTTLNAFSIPTAGQLLTAGSQATISLLRSQAASELGTGYSYTRTLTITGTVSPVCNAPTNLAENNVTTTSADFNWDAGGANNYEYVLDQNPSNPSGAGTALTTNSFSTSTLTPSTTYYFHLRRKCGTTNFSNWVMVNFTTPAATVPCAVPTGLSAANTTFNSSDLSWDVQGSNSFEYVVDQVSTDPATAGISTSGTTYNATGLNPLTTYYLHVRTNCGSGNLSSWSTISFTTLIEPCDAPTGLASTNVTHNSADLSWNAQGASTYEYVVDQVSTDPATAGTSTLGTTYNAAGLNPLTTYYLHVRTNCVQGNTSAWTTISFTTLIEPCNTPTGLASANVTHNSADLSWNAQGSSTYEYVVDQVSTDPATAGTSTSGTTYNAAGLNPLTTYYLHVRTNCVQGNTSAWTTISFTTLIEPCDAPTGLASANVTHNSADLSWNAQGASTYEYVVDQVSTDPAATGTATSGTTYNAAGLNPLTTYYLHVRTNCVQGNTSAWTTISFTTLIEPCDAPTGLASTNVTHNSADLSWNAQGSSTYEYVVDQVSTDPAAAGTATAVTTYNAAGLNQLTTYYLHVRTNCVQGNTSAWTTISFTTTLTPCIAPTGLTAANVTHNSANLSWNTQGSNTFEYVVDQTASDPVILGTPTTLTTYNPTTLNPSTTYYLHVRTDCSGANFSSWTTVSFTTAIEPCDAPTGLTDANTTPNSSELSWNTQGNSTYEYVVDQTPTDPTSGTSTADTSYDATGLDAATTYYLHVRTNCVQGNTSGWTTIPFTTLPEPCAVPTGLANSNTTHNSSDLSWDLQGSNGFEYVLDQTVTNPASGTPTTANSYSAAGLNSSTTYYFHVRTNCGNGNFSDWTTVSFTTSVAPCAAPGGLTASNVAGHTANLNWTAQSGNTFEYVLNQTASDPTTSGTATANNSFAATALNGSTTYYFHVRTNCGNGNFSNWTTVSFTTSSTVGLNEEEIIDLTVYPNPTNGFITIAGQDRGTACLINTKGQQLASIDLDQQNVLDLSEYENGVYFIRYVFESGNAIIKVVKQ
jgi:hypothetical protein